MKRANRFGHNPDRERYIQGEPQRRYCSSESENYPDESFNRRGSRDNRFNSMSRRRKSGNFSQSRSALEGQDNYRQSFGFRRTSHYKFNSESRNSSNCSQFRRNRGSW